MMHLGKGDDRRARRGDEAAPGYCVNQEHHMRPAASRNQGVINTEGEDEGDLGDRLSAVGRNLSEIGHTDGLQCKGALPLSISSHVASRKKSRIDADCYHEHCQTRGTEEVCDPSHTKKKIGRAHV